MRTDGLTRQYPTIIRGNAKSAFGGKADIKMPGGLQKSLKNLHSFLGKLLKLRAILSLSNADNYKIAMLLLTRERAQNMLRTTERDSL